MFLIIKWSCKTRWLKNRVTLGVGSPSQYVSILLNLVVMEIVVAETCF